MSFLKKFWNRYREYILYMAFGAGTTAVDLGIYYPLLNLCHVNYQAAQVAAWIGAVIFAYVTNRLWVFESHAHGVHAVFDEAFRFASGRLFSLGVQLLLMYILVDVYGGNENIVRLPVLVLVVIINYVVSKALVFRKGKEEKSDEN